MDKKTEKLKCASFFAGVGGIDLAFERAGFEIVYANEIDKYPAETYNLNFQVKADNRDIHEVKGSELPDFDVLMGGFPCQAFSIAGHRQGFNDQKGRGTLFFEMIRIIKEKKAMGKQPSIVFFENVKNLHTHDNGNTFGTIVEELRLLGYKDVYSKVLNACEYGNIPQNRERIYIVGFLDADAAKRFKFPEPIELQRKISDVVNQKDKVTEKYYYTPDKCKFYNELKTAMTNKDTIYQWRRVYVRENKSNLCPTLTANMGTGGHNVPLTVTKHGIRKLTPRECFSFQGFPEDYKLPETQSTSRLYKQAGNSVVVPVIERIAEQIQAATK